MRVRMIKTLRIALAACTVLLLAAPALAREQAGMIDAANADQGYISVYNPAAAGTQYRVAIRMNGSEQYHSYTGGSLSHISLPGSSGRITAVLYEQVQGNSYIKIEELVFQKTKVTDNGGITLQSSSTEAPAMQMEAAAPVVADAVPSGALGSPGTAWTASRVVPDEYLQYLVSSREISFSPGDSVSSKAAELVAGKTTTEAQVMAIYSYIIENYSYDWDFYYAVKSGRITTHTPDPNSTLQKRKGVCYDISSLFAAMARSVGIPTKMIKGNAVAAGGYHAWNSIYEFETLSWVDLDATLNIGGRATSIYKSLDRGYSATSVI